MMKKVFIDGSAGTTGLRIHERLAGRPEIEWIALPEAERAALPKPTTIVCHMCGHVFTIK